MNKKMNWTVLDSTVIDGKILCKCVCGKEKYINYNNVKRGLTKSCGCIRPHNNKELIGYKGYKVGDKINHLTIIDNPFRKKMANGKGRMDNVIQLKCKCDCGNIYEAKASDIVKGNTKSCGCNEYGQRAVGKIPRTFIRYLSVQATQRKLEFNLTLKYLSELFDEQNGICALSGVEIGLPRVMRGNTRTASIDRINPNKGYVMGNVQWVHKDINYAKLAMQNDDFIAMCKRVVEYNKCNVSSCLPE